MMKYRVMWVLLVLIPIASLIGWFINNPYLKSIVPGLSPMNPLTIVCFLLIAAAVASTAHQYRHAANINRLVGLFLVFVGVLILFRTFTGIDPRIDQILFSSRLDGNRVAPNTAFNLMLIGTVLLMSRSVKRLGGLMFGLLMVVGFISILSIVGYAFGLKELFGIAKFNPMALHAAVAFLLVNSVISGVYLKMIETYVNPRIVLALFLAAAVPISANVIAERSAQKAVAAQQVASQTETLIASLEKLRVAYVDAETGQRGYLLTNREEYLEPYYDARATASREMARLESITGQSPDEKRRLAEIKRLESLKFAELDQTIELKRQGRTALALAIVNSDVGKQHMDAIRSEMDTLARNRAANVANIRAESAREQQQSIWYLALSIAVDIMLLAIAFLILRRSTKEQLDNYAAIKAEKTKLKTLLESIGDGVFVIDQDKRVVLFNQAAATISGFKAEQVIGKPYDNTLKFSFEKDGKQNSDFIDTALNGKVAEMANHTQLKHRTGRMVPVADSAAPYWVDGQAAVAGVIVVFRDVSRERKLDQAKDDFVSLASHQLRTPATAVKQFLGLILDGYAGDTSAMTAQQRDYIAQASESNDEQISLVNSLLEIARIEAGTAEFNPTETEIGALLKKVADRQQMLVGKRNQKLHFAMPQPDLIATIDTSLVTTCIDNLINNASKYTPEGSTIELVVETKAKDTVISVKDNGPGISAQGISQLFQRFSRLDHSTNGTGLGLYLVKLVCELHGGTVRVESVVGKGATFSIILPTGGKHV